MAGVLTVETAVSVMYIVLEIKGQFNLEKYIA